MGRRPCCEKKEGINRGAWSTEEDHILTEYIRTHGDQGIWRDVPKRAGLNRCGKSCRLRWMNYLAPYIKRRAISADEEELILRLHKLLGNRWSLIAGRLPGRTDDEIKNYWNTNLSKNTSSSDQNDEGEGTNSKDGRGKSSVSQKQRVDAIRTKAVKYTKVVIPSHFPKDTTTNYTVVSNNAGNSEYSTESPSSLTSQDQQNSCGGLLMDFDINDVFLSDIMLKSDADFQLPDVTTRCQEDQTAPCDGYSKIEDLFMGEAWSENWWDGNDFYPFQDNRTADEDVDLNALSSYLNSSAGSDLSPDY